MSGVTTAQLTAASVRAAVARETIEWPSTLDRRQWFVSPESATLHGTPYWDTMTQAQQQLLSFWELVNFFSVNIHGERSLVEAVRASDEWIGGGEVARYLQHFVEEEQLHSSWFQRFCDDYAAKTYPDRRVVFPVEIEDDEATMMSFAQIVLFEEIVDVRNKRFAADERVSVLSRQINRLHHRDESRHLAFGRQYVLQLWKQQCAQWDAPRSAQFVERLEAFVESTWRLFYQAETCADAGLRDAWSIPNAAWHSPYQQALREADSEACRQLLASMRQAAEAVA